MLHVERSKRVPLCLSKDAKEIVERNSCVRRVYPKMASRIESSKRASAGLLCAKYKEGKNERKAS